MGTAGSDGGTAASPPNPLSLGTALGRGGGTADGTYPPAPLSLGTTLGRGGERRAARRTAYAYAKVPPSPWQRQAG
jgi:hypothetical protein